MYAEFIFRIHFFVQIDMKIFFCYVIMMTNQSVSCL